jgi:sugar phosphate isomerase/epimerase
MPLGLFSWFGYALPFAERAALVAEAGFSYTSLWLGSEEDMVVWGLADEMPGIADRAGLFVDHAHAPYERCNLIWSADPGERRTIFDEYGSGVRYCAEHGIPQLVVHITKGDDAPAPTDCGLSLLADLLRLAEDNDVVVAVENGRKVDVVRLALTSLRSPALGFCYDSSHDFLHGPRPGALLEELGPMLSTVHLSDNDLRADRHWLPGAGSIDWRTVVAAFPPAYGGVILLELSGDDSQGDPPRAYLRRAREIAEALRRAFEAPQSFNGLRPG